MPPGPLATLRLAMLSWLASVIFIGIMVANSSSPAQELRLMSYNLVTESGQAIIYHDESHYIYGIGQTNIGFTNASPDAFRENISYVGGTNTWGWDSSTGTLSNWYSRGWEIQYIDQATDYGSDTANGDNGGPEFPQYFPYPAVSTPNKTNNVQLGYLTGGTTNSRYPSLYQIYLGAKQNGQMITNTAISLITTIGTNSLTNVFNPDYYVYVTWSDCTTNPFNPIFDAGYTNVYFAAQAEKVNVEFVAPEGMISQGYDPRPGTNDDHWTSLAVGGTNEIVDLRISADWATNLIELVITGPITISQTNDFTDQTTWLTITTSATGKTNATIEARYKTNHTALAKLQILILPVRLIPVGIYRIYDSESEADTYLAPTESNAAIIERLNSVFRQACLEFYDATDPDMPDPFDNRYDVDQEQGSFDHDSEDETTPIRDQFTTMQTQIKIVIPNKGIQYPFVHIPEAFSWIRGKHVDDFGEADEFLVVFAEPAQGIHSVAAAHEVGHYYSLIHLDHVVSGVLFPTNVPPNSPLLMIDGAPWFQLNTDPAIDPETFDYANADWKTRYPGVWLRKEEWEAVYNAAEFKP